MEVHSSDVGGDTDRNSDHPRRGKLHGVEIKRLRN